MNNPGLSVASSTFVEEKQIESIILRRLAKNKETACRHAKFIQGAIVYASKVCLVLSKALFVLKKKPQHVFW